MFAVAGGQSFEVLDVAGGEGVEGGLEFSSVRVCSGSSRLPMRTPSGLRCWRRVSSRRTRSSASLRVGAVLARASIALPITDIM